MTDIKRVSAPIILIFLLYISSLHPMAVLRTLAYETTTATETATQGCFCFRTLDDAGERFHILTTVKDVTDRPPIYRKTAMFCREILKTVDFEN